MTPSASGHGQKIARCPKCRVALYSHYVRAGDNICFMRVGTLDVPGHVRPDIHIYTSSKQPWVVIPPDARAFSEFYDPSKEWPAESVARFRAAKVARPA